MPKYILNLLLFIAVLRNILLVSCVDVEIPVLTLSAQKYDIGKDKNITVSRKAREFEAEATNHLPFRSLIDKDQDTSEYWRETEILSLVRNTEAAMDYQKCIQNPDSSVVRLASQRDVRPICKSRIDYQVCPQCPHFNNHTECELFRDSCKERRVHPSEYRTYCDKKYGKYRAMFLPADYAQCHCCDECVLYRELDQSCVDDEYSFESDEFLPVTTIDFRAGCNPYWGHPEQELRALKCDRNLRRCVPVTAPVLANQPLNLRRSYRFQPPSDGSDCPDTCRGYSCHGLVSERQCAPGAFLPDKEHCNCCGYCSSYQQLNEKCASFKKTVHSVNDTKETEIEEEFIEPGCDDGLVCHRGRCHDIHSVTTSLVRTRRNDQLPTPYEPCKQELKYFKKKYGKDGHLHFNAPQCTPLWLYAPVQCRRFVCYCALEDGTFIEGIKVPRAEVSSMNCDCAREKCRTGVEIECDGFGNYKEAVFTENIEIVATTQKSSDQIGFLRHRTCGECGRHSTNILGATSSRFPNIVVPERMNRFYLKVSSTT